MQKKAEPGSFCRKKLSLDFCKRVYLEIEVLSVWMPSVSLVPTRLNILVSDKNHKADLLKFVADRLETILAVAF